MQRRLQKEAPTKREKILGGPGPPRQRGPGPLVRRHGEVWAPCCLSSSSLPRRFNSNQRAGILSPLCSFSSLSSPFSLYPLFPDPTTLPQIALALRRRRRSLPTTACLSTRRPLPPDLFVPESRSLLTLGFLRRGPCSPRYAQSLLCRESLDLRRQSPLFRKKK